MKFDFFTLGGRFFWEDVFNYQDWIIQRNVRTQKHRLIDNNGIRRESGRFEDCKATLLKYIEAFELDEPKKDTIILLHNFGCTRKSWKTVIDSLKDLDANIIALNYASFHKSLNYQANLLTLFLKNLNNKGKLYFITSGAGGLLVRKLFAVADNYRLYNIAQVLEINPINSGSDLADLLRQNNLCKKILGPMLTDMIPPKAISLPQIPKEISHGIVFYTPAYTKTIKKLLKRFESFPPQRPPSEHSYAEDIYAFDKYTFFPLNDPELGQICREYLLNGKFPAKDDED